jgi:hypothetical protein
MFPHPSHAFEQYAFESDIYSVFNDITKQAAEKQEK